MNQARSGVAQTGQRKTAGRRAVSSAAAIAAMAAAGPAILTAAAPCAAQALPGAGPPAPGPATPGSPAPGASAPGSSAPGSAASPAGVGRPAGPGSTPPAASPSAAAGAAAPTNDRAFSIDVPSGDMMHYNAATGNWEVTGRITIAYRNGSATGDKLVYNPRTHHASLTGHVTLQRGGQAYEAERADMDTSTRLFSITNFKGAIAPSELQNEVSEPIYLSGTSLDNTQRGAVEVENGRVTSCDPPEYWIDARQITVIPGDRADFRDAEIVLLNHRILKVNHLTFSLRESQRNRLLPEVGENSVEGYFAKERLPVGLGRIGAGLLLLDLMSKKGVGKGFDDAYRLLRGAGRVQFYQLHEKDTGAEDLNGSLEDNRKIGDFTTTLNTNYSKNSYTEQAIYGSQQTAFNGNFGLNRSGPKSSTNATFSLSDTNSSFSDSKSLNGFIRQHFSISQALSTDLNFTRQLSSYLSRSVSGGPIAPTPSSGQNEYQVTITDSAPALTTVMASDVHQPFGRSALFFVERYPEITFTTSSARLLPLRQLPTGQPLISATGPAHLPSPRVPAGPVPPASPSGAASLSPTGAAAPAAPGAGPSNPGATRSAAAPPASAPSTPAPSTPAPSSSAAAPASPVPGAAAASSPTGRGTRQGAGPEVSAPTRVPPSSPWYDRSPINFSLSLGHYREEPANTRLNRVDMNLDSAVPEHSVFRGLSVSGNGRFEQKMTSDGTAQYIFNLNSTLNHSFSREASFNGTYYRIQPIGYTPFQFDRSGVVNISNLGMDLGFGQQPGVVTTVRSPGSLGFLSPLGGASTTSTYGGASPGYGGYSGSSYGSGYGAGYGGYGGYGGTPGMGAGYPGAPGLRSQAPAALHLGLHTAFDFEADRNSRIGEQKWSPLNIDVMAYPTRRLTFYAASTYTLSAFHSSFSSTTPTSLFSPVRGGFRWIGGDNRFLDTSFVYDTALRQMTTLQGHILLPLGRLTTLEALAGYQKGFGRGAYDPYSGGFEQILLTRDLNCFVANLYYGTNPHDLSFTISIKAFPIQRILGVQKFGNLFNQGVGHTF